MRTILGAIGLGVLLAIAGCGDSNRNAPGTPESDFPEEGALKPPAQDDVSTGATRGDMLTVRIDGQVSTPIGVVDGEKRWTVAAVSANPSIEFEADTQRLGEVQSVQLVIFALKGETIQHSDIYRNPDAASLRPGQTLQLTGFDRSSGGGFEPVGQLPAGAYVFRLQVNGRKGWDRQQVVATVP